MTRRWVDAIWPVALLVLFVATFRHTRPETAAAASALCDDTPTHDVAVLERCVALEPLSVQLLTDLGDAYAQADVLDRAEAAYRRALDLDARDGDVHLRLADVLLRRGDADGARMEAESALRWQPGSEPAVQLRARAAEARR